MNNHSTPPPEKALRFLRWFCREDYLEEIEGNLLELYEMQYEASPARARRKFFWNVLLHFRPAFIRSLRADYTLTQPDMIYHHLLLAFRNFKRFKVTFLINLIGLSSGIGCALLIYLWVHDELSVDKFHEHDSRLYQVMKNYKGPQGNIDTGEDTPGLLARALAEEMPEVENAVSVFPPSDFTFKGVLSIEDHYVKANSKFADKDFFNIFSYPLLQGSKEQVLTDPSSVVISETLARNLFNTTDNVIGKRVSWNGERINGEFLIAGIFGAQPANTSIKFDILFNYDLLLEKFTGFSNWESNGPSTYVLLKRNTEPDTFNNKIADFVKSKNAEVPTTLFIRRFSDRYLYSDYENGVLTGGRIAYVRLFSVIAIFLLVIACINFMNLSTAKASRRLKEIGVKKVIGASKPMLLWQYLSEAMLLAFFSLILAIILVIAFLPQFNDITGKALSLHLDKNLMLAVLGITLLTGFTAGSYPAVYLSRFNPLTILKGGGTFNSKYSIGELWARKGLVIFQFTISILLITAVLVVYQQMRFIQSKNLGYEKDNVVTFVAEGKLAENPVTFLNEIKNLEGVVSASYMRGDLTGLHGGTTALEWEGKDPDEVVDFNLIGVGYDLIESLEIELAEGRTFSEDFGSENSKIIFNEEAIKQMGLSEPVGKTVTLWGEEKQIIGVVKNFHFESLYKHVTPFFFQWSPNATGMVVKIKEGTEQETLTQLKASYQEYNAGIPFEYQFMDEGYQKMYAAEQRVSSLSKYFAGIAILISCLGLFGLAAFTAERRLKEIGIRKVLGSSERNIVRLLSTDFTLMVLIAIGLALPLSYWIARNWLSDFAYRIDLEWWYFASAGLAALLIAWFSVGLQTVKAARMNPVQCLKDE